MSALWLCKRGARQFSCFFHQTENCATREGPVEEMVAAKLFWIDWRVFFYSQMNIHCSQAHFETYYREGKSQNVLGHTAIAQGTDSIAKSSELTSVTVRPQNILLTIRWNVWGIIVGSRTKKPIIQRLFRLSPILVPNQQRCQAYLKSFTQYE